MNNFTRSILICMIIISSISCSFGTSQSKIVSDDINITSIVLTDNIDENGLLSESVNEFPANIETIYCVIDNADTPIIITGKWFYSDKLIREDQISIDKRGVFFIQPESAGKPFLIGRYRFEAYLYDFSTPFKTIDFSIVDNN